MTVATIPVRFIKKARALLAAECNATGRHSRAIAYRAGSNDDQPELLVVARLLRDYTPRPIDELLAEEGR